MRCLPLAVACSMMVLGAASGRATTLLESEFTFPAERFSLTARNGETLIEYRGASREFAAGRPDLPWMGELVEVPAGLRLVRVEVLDLQSASLAASARIPSAIRPTPGLGPIERSAPDPELFSRPGFQPESPVRLGPQGWMRGRDLASLQICPVRWDASTGQLERLTRLRLRLELEPGLAAPAKRERIVPEWEDAAFRRSPEGRRAIAESAVDPLSRQPRTFAATQVPSVLGSPVEYVIITADSLVGQFQRLADWKTQSGVPTVVRSLSFIHQQYPMGSDDAERIRLFIRDAYSRWGTKWALLGGDTEILPTRYAYTTYYGGESIACDEYYSCLDGNWDADGDDVFGEAYQSDSDPGDDVDLMPDVYVGRAPVVTVAQAQRFVDKTLQYEKQPAGDYENGMLIFAEVLFPQNFHQGDQVDFDGAEIAEQCLPHIQSWPGVHCARLYENYTDSRWQPGSLPETRRAVLDSLNRGYGLATHIGHGYRNVMSCGDNNINNDDALSLTNGSRLVNLYASNCTSNAIDFPSIGEAFLHAPGGGAVTNIGSSRFDFPAAGRYFEEEYFRLVYEDSVTTAGEAQARQKLPFVSLSPLDGVNRWTTLTLLMLGDPSLEMYTSRPKTLTVGRPSSIVLSDTSFTVTVSVGGSPLSGARVVAYKPGDEYRVGTTNASGGVVLPFRADSVGSLTLTVTSFNCRPFQTTIGITPATLPVLADRTPVIDDDTLGGTNGDGNGLFDAGETVDLRVALRNNGGSTATSVVGTLSTTDGLVTVSIPTVSYGSVAAGSTVTPVSGFRVSVPYTTPDQREIPFRLALSDGNGRTSVENFQVVVNAPDLHHYAHDVSDAGGNSNGRPDPGETVTYIVKLRNLGTGAARQVTAKLRRLDGLSTVTDSTASWGTINPGEEKAGDALVFVPTSASAQLQLRVSDLSGELFVQTLDLGFLAAPSSVSGAGGAKSIQVSWTPSTAADLLGYNIYRSSSSGGPFTKVNSVPTEVAYYLDDNLAGLTRYYYQVTALDQSCNESSHSSTGSASTNPPSHALFPIPIAGSEVRAPVALDNIYPGYPIDIVAGGDYLYLWHPDGSAPVDADGAGSTSGDLTTRGHDYEAAASIADLDGDGWKEIVGLATDSSRVYVFDRFGSVKPGWPRVTYDNVSNGRFWSSPAIGDLNNDGSKEIVFAQGLTVYAFRANGTEWRDGDSNAATTGVFKVLSSAYNFGTPVLADLDGNGVLDIIYGDFAGKVNAWRPDGTNLPGFPIQLPASISASLAVGFLDGPADTQLDIVAITGQLFSNSAGDSLYAFRANGQRRPGFPVHVTAYGNNKAPSPALADINNDGYVDIVCASTNGGIYVYDRNGAIVPPFSNLRYSTFPSGASESSPVVADINGDGFNDIIIGDENSTLSAFSGANGTMLPGFPIVLGAQLAGAPAVCDCDGDGKTEIVAAGWDKNVYVWDYDFTFSPGRVPPWPQYNHDARHTGLATNPPFTGVEPAPLPPRVLEFAPPAPSPARASTVVSYAVPADRAGTALEIGVYDLGGRRVKVLERGTARVGRHTATWDLRDQGGSLAGAGVYFIRLSLGGEHLAHKLVVLR